MALNTKEFDPIGVVLAAGRGTRMESDLPKVLFAAAGKPLVRWVVEALTSAGVHEQIVVIGYGGELVRAALVDLPGVTFAHQQEQRGTGDAVAAERHGRRCARGHARPQAPRRSARRSAPGSRPRTRVPGRSLAAAEPFPERHGALHCRRFGEFAPRDPSPRAAPAPRRHQSSAPPTPPPCPFIHGGRRARAKFEHFYYC